jgi:hypothetical protein
MPFWCRSKQHGSTRFGGEKSSAPRFTIDSLAPEPEQTPLPPVEIAVATDAVENVATKDFLNAIAQNVQVETTAAVVILPSSSQASDCRRESSRTPFDAPTLAHDRRFTRSQSQYPKNIDGSDRLPWETGRRGVFDSDFEQHMARSLGNYPAYKDLLPGELLVKVRKHICAAKYDLKRRDELEIEWEAMHSLPQLGSTVSSTDIAAAKTYAHFAHLFGVST